MYDSDEGLIGHLLNSQVDLHVEYGGVVPGWPLEITSGNTLNRKIAFRVQSFSCQLMLLLHSWPWVDGLCWSAQRMGELGLSLGIPAIAVNHMEGHLLSPLLAEGEKPPLPFLALLVSGGHSQIILVKSMGDYELIGESLDDAAGEAFDKTAKIMGLGYPGGPALSAMALAGEPGRFNFPRPKIDKKSFEMSNSGLKTYTRNLIESQSPLSEQDKADISKAFEEAVVDTLLMRKKALEEFAIGHCHSEEPQ